MVTIADIQDRRTVAPEVRLGPRHAAPVLASLSVIADKRALFAVDSYFRDSWEDLCELPADDIERLLRHHALLLLKPDAVVGRRLDAALDWLTGQGTVVAAEHVRLDRHAIRAMWRYQWNVASRDRRDLSDLLGHSGGDSLALFVRLPADARPATVRLSAAKGSADPANREPWQLRYRLGNENFLLNFVHTADEPADLVREIGVLFDAPDRRRIYATLARGADASGAARAAVRDLYARQPARDLSLSGLVKRQYERLGDDTGPAAREFASALSATEAGLNADWRGLCERAARAGVPLDGWDRAVLGTHLMVASESGTVPILAGVPEGRWEARPDAAILPPGWRRPNRVVTVERPVAPAGPPALRYDRPLPGGLVHKGGIDEVFVTDSAELGQHRYVVAGELPLTHCHYNDLAAGSARYDLMPVLELCRQVSYVVTHRHLGVPRDRSMLLRRIGLRLDPAVLFADQPDRLRLAVEFTIERLFAAPREGLTSGIRLSTPDGTTVGTATLSGSWSPPETYHRMRRTGRAALGLGGDVGPPAVAGGPLLPAASVGRTMARNVLLTADDQVAVDVTYRGLFEHAQDHVPGMLLIEAARQAALSRVTARTGTPASGLAVAEVSATFGAIAELELPVFVAVDDDGTVTMRQHDVEVCRIGTRVEEDR